MTVIAMRGAIEDEAPVAVVRFADKREEHFAMKPGEPVEAFCDRVRAYAEGRGADAVIFGGSACNPT